MEAGVGDWSQGLLLLLDRQSESLLDVGTYPRPSSPATTWALIVEGISGCSDIQVSLGSVGMGEPLGTQPGAGHSAALMN